MQKKSKHRILGLLVIIGLAIFFLPLFQGSNQVKTETVVAPPPIDSKQQVRAASELEQPLETVIPNGEKEIAVAENGAANLAPAKEMATAPHAATPQEEDKRAKVTTRTVTAEDQTEEQITETTGASLTASDLPDEAIQAAAVTDNVKEPDLLHNDAARAPQKLAKTDKKAPPRSEAQATREHAPGHRLDHLMVPHALTESSVAAVVASPKKRAQNNASARSWIVQVASYHEKENAARLVKQLTAQGFQALTENLASPSTVYIRVYLGPEKTEAAARALAQQLQQKTQIKGLVVSYKPLT